MRVVPCSDGLCVCRMLHSLTTTTPLAWLRGKAPFQLALADMPCCAVLWCAVRLQDAAFFDHNNPIGLAERERAFQLALADMMGYLRSDAGQVAIFDATNSTQDRREKLVGGDLWLMASFQLFCVCE